MSSPSISIPSTTPKRMCLSLDWNPLSNNRKSDILTSLDNNLVSIVSINFINRTENLKEKIGIKSLI